MKIENEDLTQKIRPDEEILLVSEICDKYDKYESLRTQQLSDIKAIRTAIYNSDTPHLHGWNSKINLPDLYELAQTLKSHLSENLYSHPDAMFDVSGTTPETQSYANKQKAMLVNTFEQMNIENELEKVIDSIVETGECTLFVGWETTVKQVRRAKTFEEQLRMTDRKSFVLEDKVIYDNAKIKFIKPEDFVFDKTNREKWDSCAKIYRTYATLDEIFCDKSNNLLTDEKLEKLRGVVANKKQRGSENTTEGNRLEILEFWGDIELTNGTVLKNRLITVAGRCHSESYFDYHTGYAID